MAAAAPFARAQRGQGGQQYPVPDVIKKLAPMTGGVQPIAPEERQARVEKAQSLMREHRMGALVLESGTSMFYFTGTRGSAGDLAVLPATGDLAWVLPESNAGRSNGDVRTWAEGGNPYQKVAQALKDRNATGTIAMEERVRFAVFDGLRKQLPSSDLVSGDPVTVGCRVIKSPAEIALLQRANDITIAAYKAAFSTLYDGMDQRELNAHIDAGLRGAGSARRCHGDLRQVHRLPARQHSTAEAEGRRPGAGG